MKTLLVILSFLVLSTAVYAANVGDIEGGYPAGYNPNNTQNYRDSIGQPITPTFTATSTGQSPAFGTIAGPFPIGFGYEPGTSTPTDQFLDNIGRENNNETDTFGNFVRKGEMLNNVISAGTTSLNKNLQVQAIVTGSSPHSVSNMGYYVGYKVLSVTW